MGWATFGCAQNKTMGSIERLDEEMNALFKPDAVIEILGDGFEWTEGPLWIEKYKMLLFSDIPRNSIYKWTADKGIELYLKPSGYTGKDQRGGETGSNGLLLTREGKLLLCQHGNRQIALMEAELNTPKPVFTTLAASYQEKKLNSPNDAVMRKNGDIFFTDPPYGLEKGMEDPAKELPFQGVYKWSKQGNVTLLVDSIPRPNGIGFTRDEKTLIVASSHGPKPAWYLFDVGRDDVLTNGRILRDVSEEMKKEKGAPDGLKVSRKGYLFATGPGGVWIFNKKLALIGKIKIPEATANCALSDDEKTLYITSDMYLLRVQLQ